jgi:cytochrome c-type biogenesis protein
MGEASSIGMVTAFAAGIVSFLSPCVLPLVPGYVSYIAGESLHAREENVDAGKRMYALLLSAFFVLGFSTVFVALGASATALGQLLLQYRHEASIAAGVMVIVFGLYMMGLLKWITWFHWDLRFHPQLKGGHPVAAYVLGLAFAFGWTPCIGPVLGGILTLTAVSPERTDGIALLGAYSLGLGVPFLLAAAFTGALTGRLRTLRHAGRPLQVGAGAIMVLVGIAILTGHLSAFANWLLRAFPVLGTIG